MSVTFKISGTRANFDAAFEGAKPNFINLNQRNAADLLRWLGFECDGSDMYGFLAPADLRARCERRLADTPKNIVDDLPIATIARANVVQGGRASGHLRMRTLELLELTKIAGDRMIEYS